MATEPSTTTPGEAKAQWNTAETNALLTHLLNNISEAGDGRNFKTSTFTSAANALAAADILTAGPPKTRAHWDNVKGTGIEGVAALEASHSSLQQFANSGWVFYDKVAEILLHGTSAQGSYAFHPAAATAPVLVDDGPEPGAQDIITAAVTTSITSAASSSMNPPAASSNTDPPAATFTSPCLPAVPPSTFTSPRLPVVPPSTTGSSIGTGKRTHNDTLFDGESMISTHPSLSGALASTTLVSVPSAAKKAWSARHFYSAASMMTSATQGSKLMPATAVVGMQGSINCIGDILEKAVTAAQPVLVPHAMAIMQSADARVSAEEQGQLLLMFTSNDWVVEIYVQSPPPARRSYVKALLESHMAKQM
ncbi:hypothetical protein BDR07DRAFT_1614513 [Suillus spraguei]|nr:hypothetical protein BDR07DRAFT_1614513 [Suillus spraguei]